jgi:hypothetical protein
MSRGKPKRKIHDLSRTPATREELEQVLDLITAPADPIATAVLGAALVEHELEKQIRKRFKRNDDTFWKEMTGDKGPVGTFHGQIVVGFAMRIYDEKTRDALDTVRTIRNQFAHAKRPINFGEDLIIAELAKIRLRPAIIRKYLTIDPKENAGRWAYVSLCMDLSSRFIRMETKSINRGNKRLEKKITKISPLANALARSLGSPLPESLGFGQLGILNRNSDDPIPLSQLPYARGLLDLIGKADSKTDK